MDGMIFFWRRFVENDSISFYMGSMPKYNVFSVDSLFFFFEDEDLILFWDLS